MKRIVIEKNCILALFIVLTFVFTNHALADKPIWASSKNKGGKQEQKKEKHNNRSGTKASVQFDEQQRNVIHNYYTEQYHAGHCPPGLAKKNNGCMPPGQAKKWQVGQPLPREVIFHNLPSEVVVELGPPPSGYRFVRVASDILLIAQGTGMVMDAIQDLGDITRRARD
jgi:Ni/Co efflux regulator RcnB